MDTKILQRYAPAILRIGVSTVYLWFGFQQFLHTSQWVGFIPAIILKYSPLDAETLVHFNGAIEVVFGITLLIGIFSRVSAAVLSFHMAHITLIVGYDAIGVRDFGITIATVASAFFGADVFSLETYIRFPSSVISTETIISPPPTFSIPIKESPIQPTTSAVQSSHTIESMIEYIQQEKTKGTPLNNIRDSLFVKGWTNTEIESAYKTMRETNTSLL